MKIPLNLPNFVIDGKTYYPETLILSEVDSENLEIELPASVKLPEGTKTVKLEVIDGD